MDLFNNSSTEFTLSDNNGNSLIAKSVAMCALFVLSLIISLIPLKLMAVKDEDKKKNENDKMRLLLCFGGGALLYTTIMHLLPEVSEKVAELKETENLPFGKIHVAELLMSMGFFTMYFLEELVHCYLHQKMKNDLKRRGSMQMLDMSKNSQKNHTGHSHIIQETDTASLQGFLVVFALSVHELFEGLAVGLESSASAVWYMFGAVSAHKLVMAFCIGMELVATKTKTTLAIVYVIIFAAVSPLGILIGIGTTANQEKTAIIAVALQGLASGTLLYIVFFEILQKNRAEGIKNYLSVLIGFAVMFVITLV